MSKFNYRKFIFYILIFLIFVIILILFYRKSKEKVLTDSINFNKKNSSWKITQYGNENGGQLMSYTIEGNNNGLIIVDGGYENDEEMLDILNNMIQKHDNKVDAWILTHFDTDHAGAYMSIQEINKNLKVNKLYVQDTPNLETCKANANWYTDEEWNLYERYLNLNIEEKEFLHTGDVLKDIIGLRLEVLFAYENWVDEKTNNLLNNGCIIFKLYGNKESILFCGDAQDKLIGDYLIEKYGDKLKSTYLQVPHHGNNDFVDEFYKIVNPEVAFFPAPKWIMFNENNIEWFTAPYHWELLENMGAKVYYFNMNEISVTMK